ncbi:MAG: hypothetical protein AAFQ64_21170 [Pseudomonadota bacterium]
MAKLRFGGFNADMPNSDDEPWTKLATVSECLQDGDAIPPDLASWLSHAIENAKEDPKKLLRGLGLTRGRGPIPKDSNAWLNVGGRIFHLEYEMGKEGALGQVAAEENEKYSRTGLQDLRNQYAVAWRDAHGGE